MAKKITDLVNVGTSVHLAFTEADQSAAQQLGIVIGGALQDRIGRAVVAYNMAARLAVEAGYLLLSVKADLAHGEFEAGLDSLGLSRQRAAELMRMAKFATALPEGQRAELLNLPKSKVLALASADAEVIADLLEDGSVSDLEGLSVRDLRQKIRELQAAQVDAAVDRDTMKAERDGLARQLKRRAVDAEDACVPMVVADQRAELAALVKKAELSINSLYPLGIEIINLSGHDEAGVWVEPTLRLGVAGLLSLREVVDGVIKKYVEAMGESAKRLASQPDSLAFLDESEVGLVATEWATLTATHQHEAALRQHERDQAKPKGKGRPNAAPKAPEMAAKARKA
jgi:hypothetical protein